MPVSPATSLIASDDRLLGWGLSDLTLYGAPPATVTVGRAAVPPAAPSSALEVATPPASGVSGGLTVPLHTITTFEASGPAAHADPVAPLALAGRPVAMLAAEPSVPAPMGFGSTVQIPAAAPVEAVAHDEPAVAVAAHASAAEAVPVAHDLLAAAADPLPAVAVGEAVADVAAVEPVVAGLADQAVSAPAALTAPVLAPVADVTAPVAAAVGDTMAATAPLASAAIAPVADTLGTITDDHGLAGLGGHDPAAGVATLVGMVASATAFDLDHASAPAAAQEAPSIADALIAEAAPPSLLGDTHHDDGGIGHVADDHHLPLGL